MPVTVATVRCVTGALAGCPSFRHVPGHHQQICSMRGKRKPAREHLKPREEEAGSVRGGQNTHTHSHTLTRTLTEGHCVPTPHEWSFLWGRKCVFVCDPTWVLIMWQLLITGLFTHTDIMCLTKLRLCVCVCISQTSLYVWVSALKRPFLDFPSLCSEKEKDGPRELYFTCHSKCCISSVTQIWVTEQWYYNKDKLSLWSTVHILSN